MTLEERHGLALRDIAPLGAASKEEVEAFALRLAEEFVPGAALRAKECRRMLAWLEGALEARMAEMGRDLPMGTPYSYTDGDGTVYDFRGEPRWEVPDPEGLRHALGQVVPDDRLDLVRALALVFERTWKIHHEELNRLRDADGECALVVRDFRRRTYGPPHLVPRQK